MIWNVIDIWPLIWTHNRQSGSELAFESRSLHETTKENEITLNLVLDTTMPRLST